MTGLYKMVKYDDRQIETQLAEQNQGTATVARITLQPAFHPAGEQKFRYRRNQKSPKRESGRAGQEPRYAWDKGEQATEYVACGCLLIPD